MEDEEVGGMEKEQKVREERVVADNEGKRNGERGEGE